MNPYVYEYSNIDIQPIEIGDFQNDYFTLFDFSAKYDPVPTMLTQCHVNVIKGFMGQTTMFRRSTIKSSVIILGERKGTDQNIFTEILEGERLHFMAVTILKITSTLSVIHQLI